MWSEPGLLNCSLALPSFEVGASLFGSLHNQNIVALRPRYLFSSPHILGPSCGAAPCAHVTSLFEVDGNSKYSDLKSIYRCKGSFLLITFS